MRRYAKFIWWGSVALALAASVAVGSVADPGLRLSLAPLLVVIPLAEISLIAELGAYPFQRKWQVRHPITFYVYLLIVTGFVNEIFAGPALGWIPTSSPI